MYLGELFDCCVIVLFIFDLLGMRFVLVLIMVMIV